MKAPKDQHFLIDNEAVALIADTVSVKNRRVLEIGPGGGILTNALLKRGALLTAIELDRDLVFGLEQRFAAEIESGQFTILPGDAARVPFPAFDLAVANLPYSVSSKITFRLLDAGFETAVLMYQREFGSRMAAPPGNKEYGRLSVMVQTYADVEPVLELPPSAFSPQPEVWSVVVKITPHKSPVEILDRNLHEVLVRELFSHRRKTVRNGIRGMQLPESVLAQIPADILAKRPEMLSVSDFIELSNELALL
jgi:16S rRNA (adenine1518-N6/adenine1519-N6)-dimethyltransferase